MSSEHYFSQTPQTDFKPKKIRVALAGRDLVVETAGGVFSPDHIDQGTAVLLEHLRDAPAGGDLLDIGCGWGPIALSLALQSPRSTVWAVDVNDRSLELTRRNAEALGLSNLRVCRPEEVPSEIEFTGIWSNPPIRVGKDVLHEILLAWLPRLRSGAESYLVVQKNLGADSLHRWLDSKLPEEFSTIRIDTSKSFRVLRVKNRG
ncbi:MAG: class I SAM-dependent methyltransferase [Microbacteriaceae bacterium]